MTPDEQEALSCKYVMPRVMRLASGRFALFQGDALTIFNLADNLIAALPTYEELPEATRPLASPRRKALNLADLGL